VGVRPPQASWGNMLYQSQATLGSEPWLALAPGGFILLTAMAVNAIGDRYSITGAASPGSSS
jgi:peptide/nickel transport system permease protein